MSKEKIAVIGSGISGLSASFFLSNKYDVHLFEKNKLLGGHTRTIKFKDLNRSLSIDTGFIVFNEKNYPDLVSFFNYLDVKTSNSNMSFSVSCGSPFVEYGGSSFNALFSQRRNFFSIKFISLLFEINRFYKIAKKLDLNLIDDNCTIEDFLIKNKFSDKIKNLHIYPMISSIWSTNYKDVKSFPLILFINFFNNHNLFNFSNRPQWKYVSGGSYNYIEELIKKKLFKFSINCEIKKIIRKNNKIQLIDSLEKNYFFDKVIFANHANQAIEMLEKPTLRELDILSNFKYTTNKAYLHSDSTFMPKKKLAWSSWNFLQNIKEINKFSLTYWMNKLQNIDGPKNYFVSINPQNKPKDVIDRTTFEHPIFNIDTLMAQKNLGDIQGANNTFFCGSYCGYGFHEDGIQSAAYVAQKLNVKLPWNRGKNFYKRLNY